MLGLKEIINEAILKKHDNLSEAVKMILKDSPEGIYCNKIVKTRMMRMKIPIEEVKNFLLPASENNILKMSNNIARLELRYDMINLQNTLKKHDEK